MMAPRRGWWWLPVTTALAVLSLAGPAGAHDDGETTVASELVRQAIALAVNTPGDMEAVAEKIGDALDVENNAGVDLDLVRQAADALAAGDMHQVRLLLERSIGAQPHMGSRDVAPIGEIAAGSDELAVGAEAGAAVILDPLKGSGVDGPGDWGVLAGAVVLAGAGAYLALRWRPARRGAV